MKVTKNKNKEQDDKSKIYSNIKHKNQFLELAN